MAKPLIGVLGGSGVYDMDALENKQWKKVDTPFGPASDDLLFGNLDGHEMVFLPRHGRGHRIPPSEINFRANIAALKIAGVTQVISVSAVGSLRDDLAPGTFVIIDQFIDRTFARSKTFFATGLVAHVAMAKPVCGRVASALLASAKDTAINTVGGGTYIVIEGPQFSTLAESKLYRSWGCDVIGMTNMPEAKLAREAELCYATVAMVTDYDCWHPDHDSVTVDAIIKVLLANADNARTLIRGALPHMVSAKAGSCECQRSLDHAMITAPDARDPEMIDRLRPIAGRVLG